MPKTTPAWGLAGDAERANERLRLFWDQVIQEPSATIDSTNLNAELAAAAETVRHLHALHGGLAPAAARERVWQRLATRALPRTVAVIHPVAPVPSSSLTAPRATPHQATPSDPDADRTLREAEAASRRMLKAQMDEVLDTLGERDRQVLELRFGLTDGRSWTLEEVGKAFGITRERVRQIEAKALHRLRRPNPAHEPKDFCA